jgi:hypothetical protein
MGNLVAQQVHDESIDTSYNGENNVMTRRVRNC